MAFKKLPAPTPYINRTAEATPFVKLFINGGGNRLSINAAALVASGLKGHEKVVLDQDDENPTLFQVRRAEEGETAWGTLTQGKSDKNAQFGPAGNYLRRIGHTAGTTAAECGEGTVAFDASDFPNNPIVPKGGQPKTPEAPKATPPAPKTPEPAPKAPNPPAPPTAPKPEPAAVAPQTPAPQPPAPWTIRVTPKIAAMIARDLLNQKQPDNIAREYMVTRLDVNAVQDLVTLNRLANLRGKGVTEREEFLTKAEARWQDRYDATPAEKLPA